MLTCLAVCSKMGQTSMRKVDSFLCNKLANVASFFKHSLTVCSYDESSIHTGIAIRRTRVPFFNLLLLSCSSKMFRILFSWVLDTPLGLTSILLYTCSWQIICKSFDTPLHSEVYYYQWSIDWVKSLQDSLFKILKMYNHNEYITWYGTIHVQLD